MDVQSVATAIPNVGELVEPAAIAKVKHAKKPKVHKVKRPKTHVAKSAAHAAVAVSAASGVGKLIETQAVRSAGSIVTRGVSSAIVTAERLAAAKKMAAQSAEGRVEGQAAGKAAVAAEQQAAAPAPAPAAK